MNNHEIINMYKDSLKKFGDDHRALGWGSQYSQELRFKILGEIGDINGAKILDYGCGICHLYRYLLKNNINIEYVGYDNCIDMIQYSQKMYPHLELFSDENKVLLNDKYKKNFDYIFISGIFTYFNDTSEIIKLVSKLFSYCNAGLAFNSLSSYASTKDRNELYVNPHDLMSEISKITCVNAYRHDYLPNDFTIYLYQNNK